MPRKRPQNGWGDRWGHDPLSVHGRGSNGMDEALERRIPLGFDRRPALRVCVPRGELLFRRHSERGAATGSRGCGEAEVRSYLIVTPIAFGLVLTGAGPLWGH